jgi:NADP-dependent 3-hydroxy acid dehydrogenase YdfG
MCTSPCDAKPTAAIMLWTRSGIRTTVISPGVTDTELGHDISSPQVAAGLQEWRKKSLTPDAIGRAIRFALEQPDGVDVNEIIVRPTAADM